MLTARITSKTKDFILGVLSRRINNTLNKIGNQKVTIKGNLHCLLLSKNLPLAYFYYTPPQNYIEKSYHLKKPEIPFEYAVLDKNNFSNATVIIPPSEEWNDTCKDNTIETSEKDEELELEKYKFHLKDLAESILVFGSINLNSHLEMINTTDGEEMPVGLLCTLVELHKIDQSHTLTITLCDVLGNKTGEMTITDIDK